MLRTAFIFKEINANNAQHKISKPVCFLIISTICSDILQFIKSSKLFPRVWICRWTFHTRKYEAPIGLFLALRFISSHEFLQCNAVNLQGM